MEHDHEHVHPANTPGEPNETRALLEYMAQHNWHHTAELRALAESLPKDASNLVFTAASFMDMANEKLNAALALLGE